MLLTRLMQGIRREIFTKSGILQFLFLICFLLTNFSTAWAGKDHFRTKNLEKLRQIECMEILLSRAAIPEIKFNIVALPDAPGLYVLDTGTFNLPLTYRALRREVENNKWSTFYEHELVSSKAFAAYLHNTFGFSLLFVPHLDGVDIPGFDGVILGSNGSPIANFSLKTLLPRHKLPSRFRKLGIGAAVARIRASVGISKSKQFSILKEWGHAMSAFLIDSKKQFSFELGDGVEKYTQNRRLWVIKCLKLFGIKTSDLQKTRPVVVVVDIQNGAQLPSEYEIRRMRAEIEQAKQEADTTISVVFLRNGIAELTL